MALSRKEQIRRFSRAYGLVARDQNESIIALAKGPAVLEVGCGYGFLCRQLMDKKRFERVVGIDIEEEDLAQAREVFGVDARREDIYGTHFADGEFDTVILRESAHHLDMNRALPEIRRICSGRLIVLDPNPTVVIRAGRKLIGHKDEELRFRDAVAQLSAHGWRVREREFRDVVAFPLSGGLVGPEALPPWPRLVERVLRYDRGAARLLKVLGLDRLFCWRFIILAQKA